MIILLHTPLRSNFSLCTSTNFWKKTCQNLPHFLPSWYHTLPSMPIIRDVKWKTPWYIKPLTSRTTVSPSCSNFKVLLILIFLELISKTSTFGADLKLMGCIIAEKHWGHLSCVSCSKDLSRWLADFGVSSFSYAGFQMVNNFRVRFEFGHVTSCNIFPSTKQKNKIDYYQELPTQTGHDTKQTTEGPKPIFGAKKWIGKKNKLNQAAQAQFGLTNGERVSICVGEVWLR